MDIEQRKDCVEWTVRWTQRDNNKETTNEIERMENNKYKYCAMTHQPVKTMKGYWHHIKYLNVVARCVCVTPNDFHAYFTQINPLTFIESKYQKIKGKQ